MGFGDLTRLLGQFKDIQSNLQQAQEQLNAATADACSGGGMVTARVNGRGELLNLKIDKAAVDGGDMEMLEDLVVAAVNAAQQKSRQLAQQEISKVFGGLNIAGLEQITQMLR